MNVWRERWIDWQEEGKDRWMDRQTHRGKEEGTGGRNERGMDG